MKLVLALPLPLLLGLAACSGDTNDLPDAGLVTDSGVLACDAANPCPTGFSCNGSNVCVPDTTPECSATLPCGDGRSCDNGVCMPLACTDDSACGTWLCLSGLCAEAPSCETAACPTPLICNPISKVCERPGVVSCADDTECTSPQICAGSECVDPVTCAFSADCPNGLHCIRGVCDDACTDAAQCGDMAALFACQGGDCLARCLNDDNCGTGGLCEMNLCIPAECTADAQCTGANRTCQGEEVGHGRCVDVIACTVGGTECGPNFECIGGSCSESQGCRGDRDCPADRFCEDRHCQVAVSCAAMSCPAGFDCLADRCVPGGCRGSCPNAGEICVAGVCGPPSAPTGVAEVRILTPAGTIGYTDSYAFVAVALDAAGNQLPGIAFTWASSDSLVATIGSDGVATALSLAGRTEITASVDTGSNVITSDPVLLSVQGPAGNQFRVTVVAALDGAPVTATVVCNAQTQTTNTEGVALFDSTVPKTCTAYANNYAYVTVIGLGGTEAMLRLPALGATNRATGFKGQVDFSMVPSTSPVNLSFSGGSLGTPLWSFEPLDILGGQNFTVDLPVVGAIEIPSGATAAATIAGFPINIKDTYYSLAKAGQRRAWSFAGTAEIADLGIGGGGGAANLLANVLPLLQSFRHGTEARSRSLVDLPKIVDSLDFDGDGDTTEEVPDFNSFVDVPLAPAALQSLRVQLDFGTDAPALADVLFVTSGVVLPRLGMVPLGLDGFVSPTAPIASFSTGMAAPYAGLEGGDYAIMAAAQVQGGTGISAKLSVTSTLPTTVDFAGAWLVPPVGAFDGTSRELTVQASGQFWRTTFRSAEGAWYVYGPTSGSTAFTLPTPPPNFADRSSAGPINVEAVELQGNATLGTLFAPALPPSGTERLTRGFASAPIR